MTSDAMTPEREAEIRAYVKGEEPLAMDWFAATLRSDGRRNARDLLVEIDRLRAQLAALGEAARLAVYAFDDITIPHHKCSTRNEALRVAVADTAKAAREYEARVRAKALREASDLCEREATDCATATGSYIAGRCEAKLRALADDAERGHRP